MTPETINYTYLLSFRPFLVGCSSSITTAITVGKQTKIYKEIMHRPPSPNKLYLKGIKDKLLDPTHTLHRISRMKYIAKLSITNVEEHNGLSDNEKHERSKKEYAKTLIGSLRLCQSIRANHFYFLYNGILLPGGDKRSL